MAKTWTGRAVLALAVGAAVAAGGAMAQGSQAAKTAEMRHDSFKQIGAAFKTLNDELKQPSPDKAKTQAASARIATLSRQLPGWFPKGSGPESGAKTHAKPDVWTDPAGFSAAARNFQVQATQLQQAAAGGDTEALKAQFRATGLACKGCHEKYREPVD